MGLALRTLDGSLGVAIISLLGEGADHQPDPEGTFLLGAQGDILTGLQHSGFAECRSPIEMSPSVAQ